MASRSRTHLDTRRSVLAVCLLVLALAAVVVAVAARGPSEVTAASPSAASADAARAARAAPAVKARSGILIDRRTGKVLWSKNAGLRLAPASCTKIMTALLVLEHYRDLDAHGARSRAASPSTRRSPSGCAPATASASGRRCARS